MMNRILILFCCLVFPIFLFAQNSKVKKPYPKSQEYLWKFSTKKKPASNKRTGGTQSIKPTPKERLAIYNVVVTTCKTLLEAQGLCQNLREEGYPAQIFLESPQRYHVLIMSSYNEDFAQLNLNFVMQSYPNAWILRIEGEYENIEDNAVVDSSEEEDDVDVIYNTADVMPSFPGGKKALAKYLEANLNYPEEAEIRGLSGRVVCSFIVERNGTISDICTEITVDPILDAEAIRVIKIMPRWNPGKIKGKYVRVRYVLPITINPK